MRKARDRKHIDKLPKMTSITTGGQGHCNRSTVSIHRLSYTQSTVCPTILLTTILLLVPWYFLYDDKFDWQKIKMLKLFPYFDDKAMQNLKE